MEQCLSLLQPCELCAKPRVGQKGEGVRGGVGGGKTSLHVPCLHHPYDLWYLLGSWCQLSSWAAPAALGGEGEAPPPSPASPCGAAACPGWAGRRGRQLPGPAGSSSKAHAC